MYNSVGSDVGGCVRLGEQRRSVGESIEYLRARQGRITCPSAPQDRNQHMLQTML
jgi:hypothetical protein